MRDNLAAALSYYDHDGVTLLHGDVLAVLAQMPAESVDCIVTSPPYWSLRKYSGEAPAWGGEPGCEHEWGVTIAGDNRGGSGTPNGRNGAGEGYARAANRGTICRCGAWRGQYGLEPTPELYVEHTITVLRAIWRVLKPTGTVWWNIGDSYAGSGKGGDYGNSPKQATNRGGEIIAQSQRDNGRTNYSRQLTAAAGLKPKDLVLIPWRVGLAAQADGWWIRSDIIWAKPNPMPESVTDRPTKSHEYVLLMAKAERYYFDADAVREPVSAASLADGRTERATRGKRGVYAAIDGNCGFDPGGRNIRSVWNIATQPSPLAHFASFPEAMAERCIKAGCPEQVCSACGKPRERVVDVQAGIGKMTPKTQAAHEARGSVGVPVGTVGRAGSSRIDSVRTQRGWTDCGCGAPFAAGIVLDPFAGTATTLKVARDLGRKAIGIEISEEYCDLARKRLDYGVKGTQAIERGQMEMPT